MEAEPDLPAVPLPAFRQPHQHRLDPASDESSQPSSPGQPESSPDPSAPSRPDDDRPPPIASSPAPRAAGRTRTSGTDPGAAGQALTGLLVIVAGLVGALLTRGGRTLRQPTPGQAEDIAAPLGRIIARHLPTDVIGPDLADATTAAAAAHRYVIHPAGPLVSRTPSAVPTYPEEDPTYS